MTDKKKLHQILSSLWKNDDDVGKIYYNQALQDVQTAIDSLPEEPVSEDLEEAANDYAHDIVRDDVFETFIAGANWQKQQFEKNRLAACDSQTEEEAEREQDFVMSIFENEHRQPTYSDAIEYGMRVQKQQMMKGAVDGKVIARFPLASEPRYVDAEIFVKYAKNLNEGDKVKLIIIKED